MNLQDYDQTNQHKATVVSSERITPEASAEEVRELTLDVNDGFSFDVGQSIGVPVPGTTEFGHQHFRLYSIADLPEDGTAGASRIKICVKRVDYIDAYSGERYQGRASHFLCNLKAGEEITVTGPYGLPFELPEENDANMILIGMGTGIAPFRAFVKRLYRDRPHFRGAVWLFYGANSGLELLYMNDERDDFTQYYDKGTFHAIKALSPRPHWQDPIAWDHALKERAEELWAMLSDARSYVYIAGLESIREALDRVFSEIAGSEKRWKRRKAELAAGERWVELLY